MSLDLPTSALDVLCPMHLVLDREGQILHAGPTLHKVNACGDLLGKRVMDVFELKRPRHLRQPEDLQKIVNQKLRLRLIAPPQLSFKGVLVPTGGDAGEMILNLSFGISVLEGVRHFSLSNADFAATDLALELMYLVEAKTAAMDASAKLNLRLQGAKVAAEEQAYTDTLTGLKNRRALDTALSHLLKKGVSFAVMQIDLDYFKAVNDTLGHAAGDHVLKTVAGLMVDTIRENDMVARVGGDEFTIVLPDVRSENVMRRVGKRIIEKLEEPIPYDGNICRISASIGTVWIQPGQIRKMEDVLSDADVALYASKHAGRAMQTLYHPELREAANAIDEPDPSSSRSVSAKNQSRT